MDQGISYIHPEDSTSFMYKTIPQLVDQRFSQNPDAECFVFLDYSGSAPDLPLSRSSVTWRDLHDKSLRVAAALLDLGLKPSDRIAIFGRSIPEWLYVAFGCLRIKILCLPIPVSLLYSDKLEQFLSDHRVNLVILDPGYDRDIVEKIAHYVPQIKQAVQNSGPIEDQYPSKVVFLEGSGSSHVSGVATVCEFLEAELTTADVESVRTIQTTIDPDDAALVYATSGSTGIPKMVVHSHFTTINVNLVPQYAEVLDEVYFNDRSFGWLGSDLFCGLLFKCSRVHLNAPSITHEEYTKVILQIIKDEHVTSALLLPYVLQIIKRMIRSGEQELPDTFKLVVTGGEKIPEDMLADMSQYVEILVAYGSTELPILGYLFARNQKSTQEDGEGGLLYEAGGPIEIKIVDDAGLCVPHGTRGLLMSRQVTMFMEYLDDPAATRESIGRGRWFASGDMAIMYPSGRFQILGRSSDVIIKGGIKIYPSKQEAMLLRLETLSKVVVCSIPDECFHEEICAWVVPAPGSHVTIDELRTHCEQHQPAGMRVSLIPKYFIIRDFLPLVPNGKVDKKQVRAKFIELVKDN